MKIMSAISRYLLGLMFTVFGLNGFLNFLHQPPPANPLALQFLVASTAWHFAGFLFAVQLIARLLLLAGSFVPCVDLPGGRTLQHTGVSSDVCAGEHCTGSGGLLSESWRYQPGTPGILPRSNHRSTPHAVAASHERQGAGKSRSGGEDNGETASQFFTSGTRAGRAAFCRPGYFQAEKLDCGTAFRLRSSAGCIVPHLLHGGLIESLCLSFY
jgi:hypothetical protein